MTNNVVVDVHHTTTTMNRSATSTDSETYQQCNYQQFQMLVHSVVNPLNSTFTFISNTTGECNYFSFV